MVFFKALVSMSGGAVEAGDGTFGIFEGLPPVKLFKTLARPLLLFGSGV
jgi:hypothetical protein